MFDSATIGERIREARLEKAWRQKDLAACVNVEGQTVSNWERGRNMPNTEAIHALSRHLEKSVAWLLGVSEEAELVVALREFDHRLARVEEALELFRSQQAEPASPRAANGDQ